MRDWPFFAAGYIAGGALVYKACWWLVEHRQAEAVLLIMLLLAVICWQAAWISGRVRTRVWK